jgi:hypothetical protein
MHAASPEAKTQADALHISQRSTMHLTACLVFNSSKYTEFKIAQVLQTNFRPNFNADVL